MAQFISAENMRAVLTSFYTAVRAEGSGLLGVVDEDRPPVRKVVYNAMVDIARDPAYAGLHVDELNATTVEIAVDFYSRLAAQRARARDAQRMPEHGALAVSTAKADPLPSDPLGAPVTNGGSSMLLPPSQDPTIGTDSSNGASVVRCLSIDSHDRDTTIFPARYAFTYELAEPVRRVQSAAARAVVLPVVQHTINCPHLLLVIDELPSAYSHNASDVVRRAFSKVIPKSQYSSNGGRAYTVLEPIADDKRTFDPPLPSISRLSVRLLRPDGDPVSPARDDLTIVEIELGSGDGGPGGAATYTLHTDTAFETREFGEGDIVTLRGSRTGNAAFDDYINRDGGHVVLSVVGEEPASAIGRTTVVIRHAGSMGAHGLWEPAPGADDVFTPGGGQLNLAATPLRITNLSVQMSVTLELECAHDTLASSTQTKAQGDSSDAPTAS